MSFYLFRIRGAFVTILISLTALHQLYAQSDSTVSSKRWELSGMLDFFYAYDFNRPATYYRQPFLYNYNRQNEFNLNHGYAQLTYHNRKFIANMALHAGTYVLDNYKNEDELLKYVFEANVSLALDRKANWWIDAGIMSSHIGFENIVSLYNPTATFSLLAENTPYYMTGVVVRHHVTNSLEVSAMVLTGWQTIRMVSGNTLPGFGTQLTCTKENGKTFNWSTFAGTTDPEDQRRIRLFNNFYGIFPLSAKWSVISGFDIGWQQAMKGSDEFHAWYGALLIARYAFHRQWSTAFRTEYYADRHEVMIANADGNGFNTFGFSVNLDYRPYPKLLLRVESRILNNRQSYFIRDEMPQQNDAFVMCSAGLKF